MNTLWQALVTDMVMFEPDTEMVIDDIEDHLQPLWEDVSPKIEGFHRTMIDCTFMLSSMLSWMVVVRS